MKNSQFEDILIYFSNSLMGKENEEEILWDLAKNCISKLGFVDCVIYLIDQDSQYLIQKAAYGPKSPKDKTLYNPVKIAVGDGITGHVARTGKAEIVHDTSKDPRYIEDDEMRLSEICVPIVHEDVIYGVIDCEHPRTGFFTDRHLKMLSAIASICAIKIKSVQTNKALLEEQERLFKIKEEMMELKLKVLNSQLNPHFVFNAINAIQSFITSGEKKLAMEYLSIFSKLIRYYLKNLERDKVSLMDEMDMLHWYLKLQALRYDHQFEYSISMEQDSKSGEAIIPCFPILTLLENMLEHGVFEKDTQQHLNLVFTVSEVEIHLTISHEYKNKKTILYRDGYASRMKEWQDQVKISGACYPFQITMVPDFDERASSLSKVSLKIPNLH
ncbi:MAG: histidine kinase [Allomuricauda sp.]